jgi:hypothetical protein
MGFDFRLAGGVAVSSSASSASSGVSSAGAACFLFFNIELIPPQNLVDITLTLVSISQL